MTRQGTILGLILLLAACGDAPTKNASNNGTTSPNNSTSASNNATTSPNNGTNTTTTGTIAEPTFHRAVATPCDNERDPGPTLGMTSGGDCTEDADCTDGMNGRCLEEFRSNTTYCSYDACLQDSDCGADALCECGVADSVAANVCFPGNCVTDADCGETGYCSPTQGDCGAYVGTVGYYCHTLEDECVTDEDCGGTPFTTYCAYDAGVGHWKCSDAQCVG